jgi:hypothetical protein
VVQSGHHVGQRGPEDLQEDYRRRDANGQHADFGMARRYIRMAMCLLRTSQIYLPPELRSSKASKEARVGYYISQWPYLRDKWRKAGALGMAFSEDKPLGQWRNMVQELYGIKLKL